MRIHAEEQNRAVINHTDSYINFFVKCSYAVMGLGVIFIVGIIIIAITANS